MGLIHKQFIDGDVCVFGCSNCGTHLTTKDEIMSRVIALFVYYIYSP